SGAAARYEIGREVRAGAGRYDLLVTWWPLDVRSERIVWRGRSADVDFGSVGAPVSIVIELKMKGAVAAVERQAQRYAGEQGVGGMIVATTSRRLPSQLRDLTDIGGKPFGVVAMGAW